MNQRKQDRIDRAEERKAAREERTPKQQIAVLDDMLGKGLGARKERARLAKQIAEG